MGGDPLSKCPAGALESAVPCCFCQDQALFWQMFNFFKHFFWDLLTIKNTLPRGPNKQHWESGDDGIGTRRHPTRVSARREHVPHHGPSQKYFLLSSFTAGMVLCVSWRRILMPTLFCLIRMLPSYQPADLQTVWSSYLHVLRFYNRVVFPTLRRTAWTQTVPMSCCDIITNRQIALIQDVVDS